MDLKNTLIVYIFPLFIFTEAFWTIKNRKVGHAPFYPDITVIPPSSILIPRMPENYISRSAFYNREPNIILSYNPNYYFILPSETGGSNFSDRKARITNDRFMARFFKSPFSLFGNRNRQNEKDPKIRKGEILEKACTKLKGTVVDGECYEYIDEVVSFDEAQSQCSRKNGHIFTPNFDDLEYFDKLRLAMREFLTAPRNEIWIGARIAASGTAIDMNGVDVTNTQQFHLDWTYFDFDEPQAGCAILNFDFGSPIIDNVPCEGPFSFICEYRIDADSIMQQEELYGYNTNNNNRVSIMFDKNPLFFLKNFLY